MTFFRKFSRRELARGLPGAIIVARVTKLSRGVGSRRRGAIITRERVGLEFADRAHNSDSLNGTVGQRDRVSQRPAESCRSPGFRNFPPSRSTSDVPHVWQEYSEYNCYSTCVVCLRRLQRAARLIRSSTNSAAITTSTIYC